MPSSGYFASSYFPIILFRPARRDTPGGEEGYGHEARIATATPSRRSSPPCPRRPSSPRWSSPASPTRPAVGADRTPALVVVPTQWVEQADSASTTLFRRVSFTLVLIARAEDPRERFETLDRLTSIAQNALEGSTLGGGCLAGMTHVRKGRYDPTSRHPELRLSLDGGFCYTIPSGVGHDTTR